MTNQEVVFEILSNSGCKTSKEISSIAMRKYGYEISPSAVGGTLRSLTNKGKVASSNCGNGATVYWVVEQKW